MRWLVFFFGLVLHAIGLGLVYYSEPVSQAYGGTRIEVLVEAIGGTISKIALALNIFTVLDAIFLRFVNIRTLWDRGQVPDHIWAIGWFMLLCSVILGITLGNA